MQQDDDVGKVAGASPTVMCEAGLYGLVWHTLMTITLSLKPLFISQSHRAISPGDDAGYGG